MGEFFKGRRRKTGLVVLSLALAFAGGWVRCHSIEDQIKIRIWNTDHSLASEEGGVRWTGMRGLRWTGMRGLRWTGISHQERYPFFNWKIQWDARVLPPPGILRIVMRGGQRIEGDVDFDLGFLPYRSIVIPLTLVSAWLLLIKPRPRPKKSA